MNILLKRDNNHASPYGMVISNKDGKEVFADAPKKIGGLESAFRPTELVVAGLLACTSTDVLMIARKSEQKIEDYRVAANVVRKENEIPSVFEKIELQFDIKGDVDKSKIERAVKLSVEKYCSVGKMLQQAGVDISYKISFQS